MKLNKKLLSSAMALALAGLTTVGSTYAWFTSNGSASAENIKMKAEAAGKGIFVAKLSDKAWSGELDYTTDWANTKLVPATSVNGVDFYKLTGCNKAAADAGDTALSTFKYESLTVSNHAISTGSANQYYYKEEVIFIAVDKTTSTITVTPTLAATTNPGKSAFRYTIKVNAEGVSKPACVDAAQHVSADNALNAYNVLNGMDGTTYKKIATKASGTEGKADYVKGFTGNNDFDAAPTYSSTSIPSTKLLDFSGIKAAGAADSLQITTTGESDYKYVYVTVGFWLEGNDTECRNAVANSELTAGFEFSAN